MNIINILRDFFSGLRKEKPKRLMPANNEKVNNKNEMTKHVVKLPVNPKEPTLEQCIKEFISQYSLEEEMDPKSNNKTHRAFRRMFYNNEEEEVGNNLKNQKRLIEIVNKNGCNTAIQYLHGKVAYIHIAGKTGIDPKKDNEVEKLYLNCDRRNIALLAGAIFNDIKDVAGDKLQMKFISEQFMDEDIEREKGKKIKNYQRNERIVIYTVNHVMADRIAERIKELRLRQPSLFSTTKTVPLLPKKYGFIGIAKDEFYAHQAKTPLGYAAGKTYYEYLSEIMFQSVVAGFDDNISGTSSGHELSPDERMSEYISIYDEMIPEQQQEIINKSKEIFLQICRANNVKTIYTPTNGRENQAVNEYLHQ